MVNLDSSTINELVEILRPFLESERERQSFLIAGLGTGTPVLQHIDWGGSVATFAPQMLRKLADYGEKQALCQVLEYARSQVGIDKQQRIDKILASISSNKHQDEFQDLGKLENPQSSSRQTKTILFLASSPTDEDRLSLDKEVREIEEGLRRSQQREKFTLQQRSAVRPDDLRRAMLDFNPQIVHFSGHGSGEDGLVLENDLGKAQLVSTEALANLFKRFATRGLECVVLNACYSEIQADEIVKHIDYVVGMNNPIGDDAAIKFAVGFYDELGAGWSYEDAYDGGCDAIALQGIPEEHTPILKKKSN